MSLPTARIEGPPRIACRLLDARGDVLAERAADRPFYAASTIKLHVLLAVLRAAEEGVLDLDESVPATRSFRGIDGAMFTLAGDHRDATHPAEGTPITLRDLLTRMIDRSSNEATNSLIARVGLPAIEARIRDLGLVGTRVERMIGDAAALDAGLTNETTAADLAATMRAIVGGPNTPSSPDLPAASRAPALAALRAQRIPVIARALRYGVDVGSKSGEVPGIRHDVAFIGDPGSQDVRYLAVLTSGYELPQADEVIVALTAALLPDRCR